VLRKPSSTYVFILVVIHATQSLAPDVTTGMSVITFATIRAREKLYTGCHHLQAAVNVTLQPTLSRAAWTSAFAEGLQHPRVYLTAVTYVAIIVVTLQPTSSFECRYVCWSGEAGE
jgi:hypothetical protein